MTWFERFATEGLALPAFLLAFGSLVILMAPNTRVVTADEVAAAPRWLRRLALANSPTLQRRCGWIMIGFAVVIAAVRLGA